MCVLARAWVANKISGLVVVVVVVAVAVVVCACSPPAPPFGWSEPRRPVLRDVMAVGWVGLGWWVG
jgi:hypothetical protein